MAIGTTRRGLMSVALLLAGCVASPAEPTAPVRSSRPAPAKAGESPAATPGPLKTVAPLATPTGLPSVPLATPSPAIAPLTLPFFGKVLDLAGKPIAGVEVRGYVVANNGAGVISNNGGSYALLQASPAPLTTRTADDGTFKLASADGKPLNLEAVAAADLKAFAPEVGSATTGLLMKLAPTGAIAGKVTASDAGVTNFLGVDVFIPGTSYAARCDAAGAFTISDVPVGTFGLHASKTGLGAASVADVAVRSKETTTVAALQLAVKRPTITAIDPPSGGRGTKVTISGAMFGASEGLPFEVSLGGALVPAPVRVNDTTIELTVPEGAMSRDVVVTVGGLASPAGRFVPIARVGASANRYIRPGATFDYQVKAYDAAGAEVGDVPLTWTVEGDAVTMNGNRMTGVKPGLARLTLTSGAVGQVFTVMVTSEAYVESVGGNGRAGYGDGASLAASYNQPVGLALDPSGAVHVADGANHRLRQIQEFAVRRPVSYTTAGTGAPGSADGPAGEAQLNVPVGLAFAAPASLYVSESKGQRIRLLAPTGVSTVAGTGVRGYLDGPAATAKFDGPTFLALAPDGSLYVSDTENRRIRRVDLAAEGRPVATIAGDGERGDADGPGASARFDAPHGLAFDAAGDLYVADTENHRIRKIALGEAGAPVTTFAGTGIAGLLNGARAQAQFNRPYGLCFDPAGNLYVTDAANGAIRRVAPDGQVTTVVGSGALGLRDDVGAAAQFLGPAGIVYDDRLGGLVVTDTPGHVVRCVYIR